ncbi:NifU family protein [Buchnera aphidicola]|uniref:Fe/S biogenesis protein NfuA n=1 Tax=Buchnera aphidicola subsp. Tuberolachnus salignus TaxID=98804 RepID=A0A160SXR6_BUCTT|nr:NifU family protein [Buchnera aphidicola]CUR53335.1 Fe/S biogenesis protein NfuA [Buchnera aphidicola (Tuberolachnus salignus)]
MIKCSELAQLHFVQLLKKQPKKTFIRILINFPGTAHATCNLLFCHFDEIDFSIDKEIQFSGFNIYVKKIFLPYLKDSIINLVNHTTETQIVLKAPFIKKKLCIKKTASLFERVEHFFLTVINPMLLQHNGYVKILQIDAQGKIFVKFKGGCNGCSMINVTLKQNIEKLVLNKFPHLTGIHDITKHFRNSNSYY